jgi:hypothetical protein
MNRCLAEILRHIANLTQRLCAGHGGSRIAKEYLDQIVGDFD